MNNNEEKSFSAEEVNKIVEERLSRERRQNTSLYAIKELLKDLKVQGILKGESTSELAGELMAIIEEKTSQSTPENKEIANENTPDAVTEDTAAVESDPIIEKFENEERELAKAYPNLDIAALLGDEDFCNFYKAYVKEFSDATLLEVYGGFLKAKSIEENLRLSSHLKRTASSYKAADSSESSLTPTQRAIASKAGMSYREYAKLLEEIPKRKIKSN